jgi:hypothetical protein
LRVLRWNELLDRELGESWERVGEKTSIEDACQEEEMERRRNEMQV